MYSIGPRDLEFVTVKKAAAMSVIATGAGLQELRSHINEYNSFIKSECEERAKKKEAEKEKGGKKGRKSANQKKQGGEKEDELKKCIDKYAITDKDFESSGGYAINKAEPEYMEHIEWLERPFKKKAKKAVFVPAAYVKLAKALDFVMGFSLKDKRFTVVVELDALMRAEPVELMAMQEINKKLKGLYGQISKLGYNGLYMAAISLFTDVLDRLRTVPYASSLFDSLKHKPRGGDLFVVYSGERSLPTMAPLYLLPDVHYARFYLSIARAGSDYAKPVAEALLRYIRTGDLAELYSIIRNMTQTKRLTQAEREALEGLLAHIS